MKQNHLQNWPVCTRNMKSDQAIRKEKKISQIFCGKKNHIIIKWLPPKLLHSYEQMTCQYCWPCSG